MITHLFVYGTLAPGQQRWPHLAPFVVGEGHRASVPGVLYNTGHGYPAARFDRPGSINGMVYGLDPSDSMRLQLLDEVEGAVIDLFGRVATTSTRHRDMGLRVLRRRTVPAEIQSRARILGWP